MKDVKKAVEGVKNNDVRYRYVLFQDLANWSRENVYLTLPQVLVQSLKGLVGFLGLSWINKRRPDATDRSSQKVDDHLASYRRESEK